MGRKRLRAPLTEQTLALGAATVLMLVVCGSPLLATSMLMFRALYAASREASSLTTYLPVDLLFHSLGVSTLITAATVVVGVPLGVLLGRFSVRGRRWALWLHALPLFLPPFLLALGWHRMWGSQGILGGPETSALLFGEVGHIAIMTLALSPIISLLTLWGAQGVDPVLEDAARVLYSPFRVMRSIVLPLSRSSIVLGAVCVFGLSLSETGLPLFLRARSYSGFAVSHLAGVQYGPGKAMLLVLPMLAVAWLLTVVEGKSAGTRQAPMLRKASSPFYSLGRYQWAIDCSVWLVVLLGLLPLIGLATSTNGKSIVLAIQGAGPSLATSLMSGLLAIIGIAVVGGLLGHAGARGSRRARQTHRAMDRLALMLFFTPGSVLGVGLIAVWNRPELLWLYDSLGILSVGLAAHYAILGLRISHAIVGRSPPDEEEAAACAGASYYTRLAAIVLPMHAQRWGYALLLVLLFCLRDLDSNAGSYPPGYQSLTVRLFSLEANASSSLLCALSLFQVFVTAMVLLVGTRLLLPKTSP